jgi:hypothetical protein
MPALPADPDPGPLGPSRGAPRAHRAQRPAAAGGGLSQPGRQQRGAEARLRRQRARHAPHLMRVIRVISVIPLPLPARTIVSTISLHACRQDAGLPPNAPGGPGRADARVRAVQGDSRLRARLTGGG